MMTDTLSTRSTKMIQKNRAMVLRSSMSACDTDSLMFFTAYIRQRIERLYMEVHRCDGMKQRAVMVTPIGMVFQIWYGTIHEG